jgi:hypothetical protein
LNEKFLKWVRFTLRKKLWQLVLTFLNKELVLGWSGMMDEKEAFGSVTAEDLEPGDIVEWSSWCTEQEIWVPNYGIIVKNENRIQSNRVVSISKVIPINGPPMEREFFTLTLKLVNKL